MYTQSWKDIMDQVDDFFKHSSGTVWFRGHNNASYTLNSGLFRLNIESLKEYVTLEEQMYRYYKNLGHLLHGNENGWELLYSMQHHGVKTRLLDWTESFAVALYFAIDGWKNGTARIWMLDPIGLNYLSKGERKIISPKEVSYPGRYLNTNENINSLAIYPIKNDVRIISQHGVFTVQGNSLQPLEEEFNGKLVKDGYLKPVDLNLDAREDALNFLRLNGLNYFSLFPDLDGLSRYLNDVLIKPAWL
ncbi:FRG domain-containing protein [Neomoorella thermoacetica]|uniref:FRG domain-containing protein n=1 Tax=Neomoorella thermoacetica TaxID=1525 RepID=UPI0008FAF54F|nr:FRG domain-containing protein [Moorella thermoacetica]APC08574.1 FRG domain protein [Moorella thermoacetica]